VIKKLSFISTIKKIEEKEIIKRK